ncbi:type II toxin-antitoxin system RelE/ParE family toxin [Prosthecomicrobium hirschii]|uniref:type II toxin-antitoxin system RelE/ParE family toxin n=1 Tax=Prosthecodimorpha hirschii TaxID=665126 RepID=UPI00221F972E|nr:type II toxin-antitoxin system RelE/ParE family toxin [Prosthecomicrobium hirschii]MCW1839772.1 type II toxin-antitoxin system RelE/ParE family toxin [Prosthecomicrobium hirschii]
MPEKLEVVFFKTEAGNEPVLEWLRSLDLDDRRIIGADLRTVQIGWPLGMPLCRKLGDGLYEVRSNLTDKKISRLVFFQSGTTIVIVEGFIKKTQATPNEVLKLSKKRKSEYERSEEAVKKQPKKQTRAK